MFSVEFGKIYRIFLISSVSELFGNSSRINFFRVCSQETDAVWDTVASVEKECISDVTFCIFFSCYFSHMLRANRYWLSRRGTASPTEQETYSVVLRSVDAIVHYRRHLETQLMTGDGITVTNLVSVTDLLWGTHPPT